MKRGTQLVRGAIANRCRYIGALNKSTGASASASGHRHGHQGPTPRSVFSWDLGCMHLAFVIRYLKKGTLPEVLSGLSARCSDWQACQSREE